MVYAASSPTRRRIQEVHPLSAMIRPAQTLLRCKPIFMWCLLIVLGLTVYAYGSSAFVVYSWKRGVVGLFDCLGSALGHDR